LVGKHYIPVLLVLYRGFYYSISISYLGFVVAMLLFLLQVNITFGEKASRQVEKKEVPLWISESTVETREEEEAVVAAAIGTTMTMIDVSIQISERIVETYR
jgi:Na+-transporting methylmalonyl-CoA/oxaloacetate decarboxylase gamma subunit